MDLSIDDKKIVLSSDPTLFSPSAVDRGTLAMLSYIQLNSDDKILDLGCGYGVVGLWAATCIGPSHVTMCDNNETAITYARKNAKDNNLSSGITILKSDGLAQITDDGFTYILSNPPYHTDFSVPKHFIEASYQKLAINGHLVMVTKRKDWYKNKLIHTFGGVKIYEKDGYYIFFAQKRAFKPTQVKKEKAMMSKKLMRKKGLM